MSNIIKNVPHDLVIIADSNIMLPEKPLSISNERVLALSWKQPFASLMLAGKIETRFWSTNYRGLVLICSSKSAYSIKQLWQMSSQSLIETISEKLLPTEQGQTHKGLYGFAIAVGNLVDCRPMKIEDEASTFVKFNKNLYCHVYENVRPIQPFEWKGCQGWKELSDEQKQLINFI